MTKIKGFIQNMKRLFYVILVVLVIVVAIFFFKKNNTTEQTQVIKTGDFVQDVSVSGKVIASQEVSLSFKNSGRITNIYTVVGKIVNSGTSLAKVDASDAEKNVHDAEISLASAKLSLEKLKLQNSDTNMNSDLQKAYDDGFTIVSATFLDMPSTITGLDDVLAMDNISYNTVRLSGKTAIKYRDDSDALYYKAKDAFEKSRINFRKLDRNSEKVDIENIINETYDTVKILSDALKNTKNLVDYLSEDTGRASDFTTIQTILTGYINKTNDHLSAILSIQNSIRNYKQAFPSTSLDLQDLELSIKQKENALTDAKNKLEDYYIRAPFTGVITNIDAKKGENAQSNTSLITMMSADTFQIESFVPEVNISKIKIGDIAKITLDAYGGDVYFDASVISIDPAETIKDGVSTYKVKLQFTKKDERIKSGMTANVSVTVFSKPNTIVVPGGIVFDKGGKKFVQVKENQKNVDREVVVGETSALGQMEILSGLKDGDVVILNPVIK